MRTKTHHAFDIYKDQLLAIKEIAIQRERKTGKRCLIGDLVQEALDMFIAGEKSKTNQ